MPSEVTSVKFGKLDSGRKKLVFFIDDRCTFEIPADELLKVVQIAWGDEFMGPAPDSLWVFVAAERSKSEAQMQSESYSESFIVAGIFKNWYSEVEPQLFREFPHLKKFETSAFYAPKMLSEPRTFFGYPTGFWKQTSRSVDTRLIESYLSASEVNEVESFSILP